MKRMKRIWRFIVTAVLVSVMVSAFSPLGAFADAVERQKVTKHTGLGLGIDVVKAESFQDFKFGNMVFDNDVIQAFSTERVSLDTDEIIKDSTIEADSLIDWASSDIADGGVTGALLGKLTSELMGKDSVSFSSYAGKYFSVFGRDIARYRLSIVNHRAQSTYADCFSDNFLSDLAELKNGTLDYEMFFVRYGTHIVGSAVYGGHLRAHFSVLTEKIVIDETVKIALDELISFPELQGVSFGSIFDLLLNQMSALPDEIGKIRTVFSVSTEGGSVVSGLPSTFQKSYEDWYDSFSNSDNSIIIDFGSDGLVPLWRILPEEYDCLAVEMQNAFCDYYDRNENIFLDQFGQGEEKEDSSIASQDGVFQETTGTANDVLRTGEKSNFVVIIAWTAGAVFFVAAIAVGIYLFKRKVKAKK